MRRAPVPWYRQMLEEFIRRKNVEHYRKLLSADGLDQIERKYVEKLLADEAAKDRAPAHRQNDD